MISFSVPTPTTVIQATPVFSFPIPDISKTIQSREISSLHRSAREARRGATPDIRQNAHTVVGMLVSTMLKNPVYSRYQKGLTAIQQRCTACTTLKNNSTEFKLNYLGIASIIEHLFHDIVPSLLDNLQPNPNRDSILENGNLLHGFRMSETLQKQILTESSVYRSTQGGLEALKTAVGHACVSKTSEFQEHSKALETYLKAAVGLPFALSVTCTDPTPNRKLQVIQLILKYDANPNERYWTRKTLQKPPLAFQIATIGKDILPLRCVQTLIGGGMDIAMTEDAQPSVTASAATAALAWTPLEAASTAKRMDLVFLYALNGLPVRNDLGEECSKSMLAGQNYKPTIINGLILKFGRDVSRIVLEYFPPSEFPMNWIEEQEKKDNDALGRFGRLTKAVVSLLD